MKQVRADRIIVLNRTFCPSAAVVVSSLRRAKRGEVLRITASACHTKLVVDLVERLGAEIVQREEKNGRACFLVRKR